jgi:hypothetical protein
VNDLAADYRPSETQNRREHHRVADYCHSRHAETIVHNGWQHGRAIAQDYAGVNASKDLPDNGKSAYRSAGCARRGFLVMLTFGRHLPEVLSWLDVLLALRDS